MRSMFSSVVFFHLRPGGFQIAGEAAAEENIEVLVAARVRMVNMTDRFNAAEMFTITAAGAPKNDHTLSIEISRAPQPISLVVADRLRQTEARPEEVDRAGLSVVVRKNRGARALIRRKRVVGARRFVRHCFPAEFVGEILRQRTGWLVFCLRRFDPKRSLVGDRFFRRHNGTE